MNLSVVKVTVINDGEGVIATFKLLAVELPPIGRTLVVNGIKGGVIDVIHDISKDTAEVWINND